MIVDAHVHITADGKWFNTHHDASVNRLVMSLGKTDIDKAVVLPIAPFVSNQFIARACSEYPEKLIGFASVNPLEHDAAKKLEEDVTRYELKGLKLHPRLQGFQLSDHNVQSIIRKAADLKIPVVIDAWVRPEDREYQNLVNSIGRTAKKIPHAKIILSHLGGHKYNEILHVSQENRNIYFDLSFVLTYFDHEVLYNHIAPLLEDIGTDHLIYGSDYPEKDISDYFLFAQEFFDDFFSHQEKKLIFGDTIKYLTAI